MSELFSMIPLLLKNEFFVGGFGAIVATGILYVLRSIPYTIYAYFKNLLTTEFTVTTTNAKYYSFLSVLMDNRIKFFARSYGVNDSSTSIVSGYGFSIGIYKGKLFTFYRHIMSDKQKIEEETKVVFWTRKRDIIETLLEESNSHKDFKKISIYSDNCGWGGTTLYGTKPKRNLDSVILNNNEKEFLTTRIKWFLENEKWYLDRGIPYKLCILLHGQPGTGKTSTIFALASHFDHDILNVSNTKTIEETLAEKPKNVFVIIEDIDTISSNLNRNEEGEEDREKSLHKLLNVMDGIKTPHGLICFITTNHVDKLDEALIRKGRIDINLELKPLDKGAFSDMFSLFYGEDERHRAEWFDEYEPKTGSYLQDLFMNSGAEDAINTLRKK